MGYLTYDTARRAYHPTTRIALLGSWIDRDLVAPGRALEMMDSLSRATGALIVLATRAQLHAWHVHVVQGRGLKGGRLVLGTMRPLVCSGMGLAILAQLPDLDIRKIVLRSNAERERGMAAVPLSGVEDAVRQLRRTGVIVAEGKAVASRTVVAMPLPAVGQGEPYALGVAGPTEEIKGRVEEIAAAMREGIRRYLIPASDDATAA
jgi:DNA-binding IclR family transcriptional regulator